MIPETSFNHTNQLLVNDLRLTLNVGLREIRLNECALKRPFLAGVRLNVPRLPHARQRECGYPLSVPAQRLNETLVQSTLHQFVMDSTRARVEIGASFGKDLSGRLQWMLEPPPMIR